MPEVDKNTGAYYNTAILVGPKGYIGKYRKTNLFTLESRWAGRGNLGIPVFKTALGKIAMIICYDDYFFESSRLPALKGADILVFISSSGRMLKGNPSQAGVHISIAAIQQLALQNGLYVIATNRNNTEKNSIINNGVHYLGGGAIYDPFGNKLVQAPVTKIGEAIPEQPNIIYTTINPKFYNNKIKALLNHRRPELYKSLYLYMAPRPVIKNSERHHINGIALQYTPALGDKAANKKTINNMLEKEFAGKNSNSHINLIVLPELSLIGQVDNGDGYKNLSESLDGKQTVSFFRKLAIKYHSYFIFGMPEKKDSKYYNSAILMSPVGNIVGVYRKTHLNAIDKTWATAGDVIPVFKTKIGRIGIMLDDEAMFPEISGVLAVKRADIIAIPAMWHGQYGKPIELPSKFLVKPYPKNTMALWNTIAKYAQTHVIVSNFVGSKMKYKGSSALYFLDPVNGYYPPITASDNKPQALHFHFETKAPSTWWTNQQILIDGRRPDLYLPLIMDQNSDCFKKWVVARNFYPPCSQSEN
jgi:predicted amidohydrolase